MTATLFDVAHQALLAVVKASPALAGGRVLEIDEPIDKDWPTGLVVALVNADPTPRLGSTPWTTRLNVRCCGRGTTARAATVAADELLQAVWVRLFADPKPLPGLLPGPVFFDSEEADDYLVSRNLQVVVQHQATTATLTPRTT